MEKILQYTCKKCGSHNLQIQFRFKNEHEEYDAIWCHSGIGLEIGENPYCFVKCATCMKDFIPYRQEDFMAMNISKRTNENGTG